MITIKQQLTNFVRPSDHSIYSPSSMERIFRCPASVGMSKLIPSIEGSTYAVEGTMAHTYAEAYFYEAMYGISIPSEVEAEAKDYSSYGDMVEGAELYLRTIQDFLNDQVNIGEVLWFGLEKGIPIFAEEGAFGTADCVIVGTLGAAIVDYKFGVKRVNPDSLQLKAYIAGVLKHLEGYDENYRLTCAIVQPRVQLHSEYHSYSVEDVVHFIDELEEVIKDSKKDDLVPVEGSHCHYCPANQTKDPNFKCPVKKDKAVKVLENDFKQYLQVASASVESFKAGSNPERDEALRKIIALKDLVNEVANSALEEFEFRLGRGESIKGARIVEAEGRRTWRNPDADMAKELAKHFPDVADKLLKTVPETKKLVSISEFEKLVKMKGAADSFTVKKISKKVELHEEELEKMKLDFMSYALI